MKSPEPPPKSGWVKTRSLRKEQAFGEIAYLVEDRLGHKVMDLFLNDLSSGAFTLDWGEDELSRARQLAHKYADLPLGFTDTAVAASAEANGKRVLTLDSRDFSVIAKETGLTVLP
jgi:predicted nucleic acid-binding protein